jgi:hypothetical protein
MKTKIDMIIILSFFVKRNDLKKNKKILKKIYKIEKKNNKKKNKADKHLFLKIKKLSFNK